MYERITIMGVEDWGDKWQVRYAREFVPETPEEQPWATQGGHCFPKDVFEWRAAEYGIDPTDMDTLVDIVLVEPFISPGDMKAGEMLHDAPTIAEARQAHLARCSRAKLRARITTRTAALRNAGGLLDQLRTQSPMDTEVMQVKEQYVREMRQAHRDAAAVEPRSRARQLVEELERQKRRSNG